MTAVRKLDEDVWEDCGLSISNLDHEVDEGFAEALQGGDVLGHHFGWNFCGTVWWDGKEFVEVVWVYHSVVGERRATSLEDLMRVVNDEFGWE